MDTGTAFPVHTFDLGPEHTGRAYRVTVELPNRYDPDGDKSYPLVVVLDGQWVTGIVRDSFRILPLDRELPEAVVVGVEHLTDDFRTLVQHRAADFTPTQAASPAETGVVIGADQVGGAARFRRVLIDHIMAAVTERWRVSDDRTFVGHSFSGLFGLDTLLNEPEAFHRWVLASPSVWWDDRVMFAREAEHARHHDDVKATVFMSMGSNEGGGESFGGHQAFHRQLSERGYANLRLHWRVFDDETHQSVIAPAVARGLRTVFAADQSTGSQP